MYIFTRLTIFISYKYENGGKEVDIIFTSNALRLFILLLMYVYFQFRIQFTENCIDLNVKTIPGNHVMRPTYLDLTRGGSRISS
jgi:hypothetical protein